MPFSSASPFSPPAYLVEACVEGHAQSLRAAQRGAQRLELCADLDQDGLTPDFDLIARVQQQVSIPVRVMIRPRGGDFVYTAAEVQQMQRAIAVCRDLGVEGVVLGGLQADGAIDLALTQALITQARPLTVTFHRAIEQAPDLLAAAHQLLRHTEVDAILTSGGGRRPQENLPLLRRLLSSMGERELVVCGKVGDQDLPALHRQLGARAYHGRQIVGEL